MTTVPELVAPRDPGLSRAWRSDRRAARRDEPDLPVAMALVTDGSELSTADVLRDAGVDVVGLLAPEPLESLAWAAEAGAPRAYSDLIALLSDDIEAVCVEMAPPASDIVARRAAEAGLHVLLAKPATAEAESLRAVADIAEDADLAHVVALDGRAWPAAWHVQASVHSLGRLSQITVVGAPAGPVGRAEMIDLALRWCGEIVAVCADPGSMPATALTPDAPVTLALLAASGTTILINERMSGEIATAVVTVCGDVGRMVVQGRRVRRQDSTGVRDLWMPTVPAERPGLVEATYDVVRAAELNDPALVRGATFHDLLTASRLQVAASASRKRGGWVEL
ncbi:dehydrogenase [Frankia sp. CcI49]|uniref:Gfo/Idh/MocA family oxidoreductase n=1 Tax=unclassified Frankia TaxID=2632575 RepID=UPI0006C9E7C0|nr:MULTISPECIES: Gfo/Idh/MocA family oxidoreductase [unclassified Frankia]KPM52780.1 dehydrogenase [Frankia sp. R43]ONH57793.1 dehydrogenase [Frankia sp. CcI49]